MPLLSAVAAATARAFGFTSGGIIPITATGGTILTPGNGYKYHVFTSPGTFNVVSGNDEITYLVVAGGGAGARPFVPGPGTEQAWGGGGGGGVISDTEPVSPGPYTVTIGAGGTIGPSTWTDGNPTVFGAIVAAGGGKGGGGPPQPMPNPADHPVVNGFPGGSGGGGGRGNAVSTQLNGTGGTGNSPPVSPPQGNPGGSMVRIDSPTLGTYQASGGGGGGGSAGASGGANPSPTGFRAVGSQGGRGRSLPAFAAPIIGPAIPTTPYPLTPAPTPTATHQSAFIYGLTPSNYYAGGGAGRAVGPGNYQPGPPFPPTAPNAYLGGANGTGLLTSWQGGGGNGNQNTANTVIEGPLLPPDVPASFRGQHRFNALANTGGGGAGVENTPLSPGPSPTFPLGQGRGGSGLVVVRYPV